MEKYGLRPDLVIFNNLIDAWGFQRVPEMVENVLEKMKELGVKVIDFPTSITL